MIDLFFLYYRRTFVEKMICKQRQLTFILTFQHFYLILLYYFKPQKPYFWGDFLQSVNCPQNRTPIKLYTIKYCNFWSDMVLF